MHRKIAIALTAAFVVAGPAAASDELAKSKNCTTCHGIDKKIVGPAYKEVSKKYAGQADAKAKLAASIKQGGAGKWGPVPMPAQPNLSDDDLQALAGWILAGAK